MPDTGGGCTTKMSASWIAANLPNSAPVMAAADFLGSLARFSHGSRVRKMAPELGALVKVAPEKPTKLTPCSTPGVPSAMSIARRYTSSVRASDAPGGSWITTMR